MTFLNPIYLWSLLGIMIPVAIHLWSRRKVVRIKVGSTKLLQESEPKQTSTIRINELWLLFLRILTITLLALIISEPQFKSAKENIKQLYIIEPSLITSPKLQGFLKDVSEESIRLMIKDFPDISNYDRLEEVEDTIPDYWQLAQEMGTIPADSIVVITNGFVSGINGRRPTMPNHINWTVIESDETSKEVLRVKKREDSLELLTLLSDFEKLRFEKRKIPQNSSEVQNGQSKDSIQINGKIVPLVSNEPMNILIVYTDSLLSEQQYISSAYSSVSGILERPIAINKTSKVDSIDIGFYDVSIWLGIEPKQDIGKTRLLFKPDSFSTELIVPGNTKNEFFLTNFLNSENSVVHHLPEELYNLLNLNGALEKEMVPFDKRTISVEELRPTNFEAQKTEQLARLIDVSPWLWVLLLLVLITERILAKYRKQ